MKKVPPYLSQSRGQGRKGCATFRAPGKRTLLTPKGKSAQKAPTSVISETQEGLSKAPAGLPTGPGEEGLEAGTRV